MIILKRNVKLISLVVMVLLIILLSNGAVKTNVGNPIEASQDIKVLPRLIAHAGGDIYGISLTNSMDAINTSYEEGFTWIEVDIQYSSDGIPICIHDWGNANWYMNIEKSTEPTTFEQFRQAKGVIGIQLTTLELLEDWLVQHPNVFIITDIKEENVKVLQYLKETYPKMYQQVIPQIYSFEEYNQVLKLGYENIILTLYKSEASNEEVVDFCKNNKLLAVTMNQNRGQGALPKLLEEIKVPCYVHTINMYSDYKNLRNNGVYGVYTDYFQPNNWVD